MDNNINCNSCNSCYSCNYCDYCNSCYSCNYCDYCDYCYSCYYCKNLKMIEYNIFCWAEEYNDKDSFQQARYRAFNKEVGEKRYKEIKDLIRRDILKDLELELNKNSWEEEWKKVTSDQWRRILEIPEADKEIIENIIGFDLDLELDLEDDDRTEEAMSLLKSKGYKIVRH